MTLCDLLQWLKNEGAPDSVIRELEQKIERRRLRIDRHEQDIRRWIEERQRQEDERATKTPNLLLILLLLLLLEGDREDDEFGFSDLMRVAPPRPADVPGEQEEDRRERLGAPKW